MSEETHKPRTDDQPSLHIRATDAADIIIAMKVCCDALRKLRSEHARMVVQALSTAINE